MVFGVFYRLLGGVAIIHFCGLTLGLFWFCLGPTDQHMPRAEVKYKLPRYSMCWQGSAWFGRTNMRRRTTLNLHVRMLAFSVCMRGFPGLGACVSRSLLRLRQPNAEGGMYEKQCRLKIYAKAMTFHGY